jgi:hypothetical protein
MSCGELLDNKAYNVEEYRLSGLSGFSRGSRQVLCHPWRASPNEVDLIGESPAEEIGRDGSGFLEEASYRVENCLYGEEVRILPP